MSETPRPRDPSFTAADLDLDLVADDLADALDPVDTAALHELLARDPAAQARHDDFADALESVGAVLAAQPHPALPDDVLIRLDAALAREWAARDPTSRDAPGLVGGLAAGSPGAVATPRREGRLRWPRALGPWAGGLLGTAAVVGGLFFALHTVGSSTSATTSAASAASSLAPERGAAAGARAPSAAARPLPASPAFGAPDLTGAPVTVTVRAGSLTSVVRALFAAGADHTLPARSPGPAVADATASAEDLCLPAGVPASSTIVSRDPVTFRGMPATLLVLHERGAPTRVVRAEVFRNCGSAVLLTGTVTLAR